MKTKSYKADLLILLATFFWGSSFIPVKALLGTFPPYELLCIRFGMVALLLLPFAIPKFKINPSIHIGSPLEPKHYSNKPVIQAALILGLLCFGGFAFQTVGMKYTTATNAAFVTGLNVVFTPIFLSLLGHHRPRLQLWICVLISLIGLFIFSSTDKLTINYGDFLVLFCAILFTFHLIYTPRYAMIYDPLQLAFIQFVLVFILSGITSLVLEKHLWYRPQINDWINISYLAIFATGVALLIQVYFQKFTETTRAALIYIMEPVFAAILGFLILNERLTVKQWIGAILILLAMLLSEIKFNKKTKFIHDNNM